MQRLIYPMDENLLREIKEKIPYLKSVEGGWRALFYHEASGTAGVLHRVVRIVLEQQKEIEELKEELEELKKR